jgi:tagatose 6-phosphate kinase
VARVIQLCGSQVIATGFSGGFNGKYLEELLKQDDIEHKFAHIGGETRSCINILDHTYGSTEFLEPGCPVTTEECENFLKVVFPKAIENSQVVTISGSIPKGVDDSIYQKMIEMVKQQGKSVILDTSGEVLRQGMKVAPTMVKPNLDELESIFGNKINKIQDVVFYAKKIYESGISYVVVSLGKDGAMMVSPDGIFQAVPPKLDVVNTVGCGDSMVGAFAVAMERKFSPQTALKYAVSVASANAMCSKTGDFDPKVSCELLDQIDLKLLSCS